MNKLLCNIHLLSEFIIQKTGGVFRLYFVDLIKYIHMGLSYKRDIAIVYTRLI